MTIAFNMAMDTKPIIFGSKSNANNDTENNLKQKKIEIDQRT